MLYAAIKHVADQLNQFLKRTFDLDEDIVVISNIIDQDGTVAANITNRVVASLVNVERDTMPGTRPSASLKAGQMAHVSSRAIHINVYLLFAANFNGKNYAEALKFLSNTISFFQRNPLFTQQNSPELDPHIAKLSLDIENLDMSGLSSLWMILSGKYLPSVLYKIRMVTFDAQDTTTRVPTLSNAGTQTAH